MTHWPYLPPQYEKKIVYDQRKSVNKVEYSPIRPSKYHNKKTEVDGIVFDSQKEADYYCQLKILKKAGEVRSFELQPRFLLIPAFELKNEKYKAITYVADFDVELKNGSHFVVDVKGMKTPVYKLKKKLFRFTYPEIDFREI